MAQTAPKNLGPRGRKLWRDIAADHTLDAVQKVQLEEACRVADRLEKLDEKLRGDSDSWAHLRTRAESMVHTEDGVEATIDLVIDSALTEARQQQNVFKQLLAALRLEDVATGVKPQRRGGARGSYAPKQSGTAASNVVSLAARFGA